MVAYEKWQIALAAIELYLLHGADLLVVPLISTLADLYTLLRAYEQTANSRLRVQPAAMAPLFVR